MVVVQENPRASDKIGGATPGEPSEALTEIIASAEARIAMRVENGNPDGAEQLQEGLKLLLDNYQRTGRIETEAMDPASPLGNIAAHSTDGRV